MEAKGSLQDLTKELGLCGSNGRARKSFMTKEDFSTASCQRVNRERYSSAFNIFLHADLRFELTRLTHLRLVERRHTRSVLQAVAARGIPAVPRAGPARFGTARLESRYSVWKMRSTWRSARERPDFRPICCRLAGCGTRFLR